MTPDFHRFILGISTLILDCCSFVAAIGGDEVDKIEVTHIAANLLLIIDREAMKSPDTEKVEATCLKILLNCKTVFGRRSVRRSKDETNGGRSQSQTTVVCSGEFDAKWCGSRLASGVSSIIEHLCCNSPLPQ